MVGEGMQCAAVRTNLFAMRVPPHLRDTLPPKDVMVSKICHGLE